MNSIGLYIPNYDYTFQAKKVKAIQNFIFVTTKQNEIIVYKKDEDTNNNISKLICKFILLTHSQIRSNIVDIFIIKNFPSLLVF